MIETDWACVAFTRTRGWEERDRSDDDLTSYGGLLQWAERVGIQEPEARALLEKKATESPEGAERVLETARAFRTALYDVFAAATLCDDPDPGALDLVNRVLRRAERRLELRETAGRYELDFTQEARRDLEFPLWAVARSAAELLTSPDVERLKLCHADDCGWLFIDASRNRSRRWCDMSDCGNRAKVRRFRERLTDSGHD